MRKRPSREVWELPGIPVKGREVMPTGSWDDVFW